MFENLVVKAQKMKFISNEDLDKFIENYKFLNEEFICLNNLLKYIYSAILEYHKEGKQ